MPSDMPSDMPSEPPSELPCDPQTIASPQLGRWHASQLCVSIGFKRKACLLCTGALAGSITGVATTPLDVIKTRLMTQGSKRTYTSVFDCASKIAREEGYATFLQVWCLHHFLSAMLLLKVSKCYVLVSWLASFVRAFACDSALWILIQDVDLHNMLLLCGIPSTWIDRLCGRMCQKSCTLMSSVRLSSSLSRCSHVTLLIFTSLQGVAFITAKFDHVASFV